MKLKSSWPCLLLLLSIAATTSCPRDAVASDPRLSTITPRGVQRGADHTLRFQGARIGAAEEVLLYQSGLSVKAIRKLDDNAVEVDVTVAADCPIGEHLVQLRTPRGISDFRSVYVGLFPVASETEPNPTAAEALVASLNTTCCGVITGEDVDAWAIDLKAGQRLSVEIEALRLGYLFDPHISVIDERRFELASSDDSPLFRQDGALSFLAPADGRYTILVRESAYGGNDQCHYRMHVGDFPRPLAVVPAGGPPGESVRVRFFGDPAGEFESEVTAPQATAYRTGVEVRDADGRIAPSLFNFRINGLPNHIEQGQTVDWPVETALKLPVAINGVVASQGEIDWYLFEARAGQVWDIEAHAQRLGSALDPVINVFDASRNHLVGNDDSRGADAWLRFTAPADGTFYLRVMDHLQRGSSGSFYRVEMVPVAPQLSVNIPRVDRYSQSLQTIPVPAGGRFATVIQVNRQDFGGVVEVLAENLPPGITMDARPTEGNHNQLPVVFEASPDAARVGALVDLKARLTGSDQTVEGRFYNFADFVNGEPNQAVYYGATVDRLAMAVTQAAPFKVELRAPTAPLVQDGSCNLRVVVTREEGFAGEVHLRFPFRPPGIGTNYQITLPADQTEIDYPLNASGNAQAGKWPVFVVAFANVEGGNLWTSSQMAELNVAGPFVRIAAGRSACEPGQIAQVICDFEQLVPFEGEGQVKLNGLPPGATAAPLVMTSATTQLVFNIQTTAETPQGTHKSLFCEVSTPFAGEQSFSVTGRTELQVTPPPPMAEAAPPPEAAPAPPPEPTERPLSRLEQLRKAAREQSGEGASNERD
jgi:hypothetical protein